MSYEHVIVLGAGIQGVCAALALRQRGYAVTMVDEAPDAMLRASRVNEGKIHLGHVYANDPSFETSRLLLEAALEFAPRLEQWVGQPVPWASIKSRPFTYLVAKDSLVPQTSLFAHYERLNQEYLAVGLGRGRHYLGDQPRAMWQPVSVPVGVNPKFAAAAVATPEVSICPVRLGDVMRRALGATAGLEALYRHSVKSVARTSNGFRIEGTTADRTSWRRSADAVVNCLWNGRLEIDQQLGVGPRRAWVHRLKYRILADLPASLSGLPSLTVVLGPFGDLVTNPHDNTVYLSWYPCCLRGWCRELRTPSAWEGAISGNVDAETARTVARETLTAFDTVVPGLKDCRHARVAAGVIVSWGETDIDDPHSQLHERHRIGVHAHDGYFSIDTGKLTCAPLFARHLVDQLTGGA